MSRSKIALKDIVYPPGCKEVNEDLASEDLVRRLNHIALAFQQMNQDDDNTAYLPLAVYLVNDFFLENPSRDARLLVACAIADVFRVYAPKAPYDTPEMIKRIFMFFIQQLKGLQDPKETNFKRHYYLLENLAWVKSFNLCIEIEESQEIFCELFSQIFRVVGDTHSDKVKNIMLDLLAPIILEGDAVSNKLLRIILNRIIDPRKTANKAAYWLASSILDKTSSVIEPYIQAYFSNILDRAITGDDDASDGENDPDSSFNRHLHSVSSRNSKNRITKKQAKCAAICDMIYELYRIKPMLISGVFNHVESKLKDNDETERVEFTKLVARLFSDKESRLYETHPDLWKVFLGRFKDISPVIRCRCVQYSMHLLINHPQLKEDITEQLRQRQHDKDETVRFEVVLSIISAAKKGLSNINYSLLSFVKERALDARFKIRREALLGMAQLYKQYIFPSNEKDVSDISTEEDEKTLTLLSGLKNRCMSNYFQINLEDKLLVERILITCLVPFQLPMKERMKALYTFYCTLEPTAAKAFNELLKQQQVVRRLMKDVMDVVNSPEDTEEHRNLLKTRILAVAKNLTEPVKSEEFITRLVSNIENNEMIRQQMSIIVTSSGFVQIDQNGKLVIPPSSAVIESATKDILKSLGFPVQTNSYYMIIKQLMERISPVMIDHQGLLMIFDFVSDSLIGDGEQDIKMGLRNSAKRGLELILILSQVFPAIFYGRDIFTMYLLPFLWHSAENSFVAEIVMQILSNIGDASSPESEEYVAGSGSIVWWAENDEFITRMIDTFILNGSTIKQAKMAVRCIANIIHEDNKRMQVFAEMIDKIKAQGLTLDSSPRLQFHLAALGQICISGGHAFFPKILRSIIQKFVVQNLLLKDVRTELEIENLQEQEMTRENNDFSSMYEHLSIEVKAKIQGIKLLAKWIQGLKLNTLYQVDEKAVESNNAYVTAAQNTFRLLKTLIQNEGDLNQKGLGGTIYERAFLRLTAGQAMLKISAFDALTSVSPSGERIFGKYATTLDIMSVAQWHTLATLLIDSQEFVREKFFYKLNKGLASLNLGLEFLAYLCLGGFQTNNNLRNAMLKSFVGNCTRRREVFKARSTSNLKAVMPDCAMQYVVHLLANMPFYTNYSSLKTPELEHVQSCMWFVIEPLITRNEFYSFSFFKKMFDNIKMCVDRSSQALLKQDPKNEDMVNNINLKIYCCCDLGLGLIMSKTQNFISKEFPIEPSLSAKYYTALPPQNQSYRSYLPQDMNFAVPKRCELEAEVCGKVTKGFSQARFKSAKNVRQAVINRSQEELDEEAAEAAMQVEMAAADQAEMEERSQEKMLDENDSFQNNVVKQQSEQEEVEEEEEEEETVEEEEQPVGRKRGRPKREVSSPAKTTRNSVTPTEAVEPARKSSRLSSRREHVEAVEEKTETPAEEAPRRRGRPRKY